MNLINPIVTALKKKDEKGVTTVETPGKSQGRLP